MQCVNCGKKAYANEKCACGTKAPKKNNCLVRIDSVVSFIAIFISVLFLIMTLSFRDVVNNDLIVESIEELNIAAIEIDDNLTLDEYIYEEFVDDPRISVENVKNLLDEPFIKDFIIEKVYLYQDFLLDNGDLPYITANDIIFLIDSNSDLIYNEVGLRFLESDKAALAADLSNLDDFNTFCSDYMETNFGSKSIQTFFSFAYVIFNFVFIILIFAQWLVVYILNNRRLSKLFRNFGIAVSIPSFLILAMTLTFIFLPSVDMVDSILGTTKYPFIIYSVISLVIGILFTIFGIFFNKKYKSAVLQAAKEVEDESLYVMSEGVVESDVVPDDLPATSDNNAFIQQPNISESSERSEVLADTQENSANADAVVKNICPNCSFENKSSASFCSRCGTKLNNIDKEGV